MEKLLGILIPVIGVALVLAALFGYTSITAVGGSQLTNRQLLDDTAYFLKNQEMYGDCHYTVEIGDFSIATVTNKYYNQGASVEKLESLSAQFKDKFKKQCSAVLKEYRDRFAQYQEHKKEAAAAELSQLDIWLGKQPEIIRERSPVVSFYERFDPKSLQHPTNPEAKMLYSIEDYDKFVSENL